MTKSYVDFLEGLYTAIMNDICERYPELRKEWTRDHSRLLSCVEKEGLAFFTLTLPAIGKHFDRCLDEGAFSRSGLAFQKPYGPRTVIPGLFRALLLKVFDENGVLRTDVDSHAVAFLRQLYYTAKKLRMECKDATTYQAVADFYDIERSIRKPDLCWADDILDPHLDRRLSLVEQRRANEDGTVDLFGFQPTDQLSDRDLALLHTIQLVADRIVSGFGEVEHTSLRPKHGPGAVADLKGSVSKYTFPNWPAKLDRVFPLEEFAFANLSLWEHTFETARKNGAFKHHEPPSRLLAVPKTQKSPRLIAAEPTSHQWMQQALKRDLERKVSNSSLRNCIDFRRQDLSAELALRASLDRSLCTIDLSSASDHLSCWLIERLFRSNYSILEAFHAVRTRWLVNTIDKKHPKYIVLKKFTTQGSALTFPVQSIVYSIITIGTFIHERNLSVNRYSIESASKQIRIFGDDIIAPNDLFGVLSGVLETLGFKVNPSKSFSKGNFRESCGMDAYAGVDVTPAYVLEPYKQSRPESVVSLVECSNNFFKKHWWHAARYLQRTVPERIRRLIPTVTAGSGLLGWTSFSGTDSTSLKKRWNSDLHRWETRILSLVSRVTRLPIEGAQGLLQYYTEAPEPDIVWESGISSRPKLSLRLRWVPTWESGFSTN